MINWSLYKKAAGPQPAPPPPPPAAPPPPEFLGQSDYQNQPRIAPQPDDVTIGGLGAWGGISGGGGSSSSVAQEIGKLHSKPAPVKSPVVTVKGEPGKDGAPTTSGGFGSNAYDVAKEIESQSPKPNATLTPVKPEPKPEEPSFWSQYGLPIGLLGAGALGGAGLYNAFKKKKKRRVVEEDADE